MLLVSNPSSLCLQFPTPMLKGVSELEDDSALSQVLLMVFPVSALALVLLALDA